MMQFSKLLIELKNYTIPRNDQYISPVFITGDYSQIVVVIFSTRTGSLDILQSFDGTDWDILSNFSITSNTFLTFIENVKAKFFMVRFRNTSPQDATINLRCYLTKP
jgi:hypothetical protein